MCSRKLPLSGTVSSSPSLGIEPLPSICVLSHFEISMGWVVGIVTTGALVIARLMVFAGFETEIAVDKVVGVDVVGICSVDDRGGSFDSVFVA